MVDFVEDGDEGRVGSLTTGEEQLRAALTDRHSGAPGSNWLAEALGQSHRGQWMLTSQQGLE